MKPGQSLSTSSQGLSATTELRLRLTYFLRFKDFVRKHAHGRVKAISNSFPKSIGFAPLRPSRSKFIIGILRFFSRKNCV